MNPRYDPDKPHHTPAGFRSPYEGDEPKSLAQVMRWKWQAARAGLPAAPQTPIARVEPELAWIAENARAGAAMQPAISWIGHSSVLAQLGGITLLTDPIFSERASPLGFAGPRRHSAPGMTLSELPRIDLVLVSHNHYDHLDAATVLALAAQAGGSPQFVVPLGLARWFTERGIARVLELDWWENHVLDAPAGQVEVLLSPARHWSARGLGDRLATLWGGFAVLAPDCHLFYAGDTGYSRDFTDLRERLAARQTEAMGGGFDIALLPIGAYEPRWFMQNQHINPTEAVKIHRDIAAKRSLGIHWGTFELTDEALDEPPRALSEALSLAGLSKEDFFVVALGETRRLMARQTPRAAAPPGLSGCKPLR